jgi:fructose-bisphosphate aldolase, class II
MANLPIVYSMAPLLQAAEQSSLSGHPAAIGAFNVNFFAQALGILEGLIKAEAPGIVQSSKGANSFQGGPRYISGMIDLALSLKGYQPIIAKHLDHGDAASCRDCIDAGFGSVMIDASTLAFEANIEATKAIVGIAHPKGVTVEGEYGLLKGVEEHIVHQTTTYADPANVPAFFRSSGADALAIAYGTSHGAFKGNTDALNINIVSLSYQALKAAGMHEAHFLVSHGSSAVPEEYVAMINQYGGAVKGARGVPSYMISRAIAEGMRKVNIDTDLRLAMTGVAWKFFTEHPDAGATSKYLAEIKRALEGNRSNFDPRGYLKPIMTIDPALLREDYHSLPDSLYIEFMDLLKDTVADQVAKLSAVFGAAGLVSKVDTNLSLEEMARRY